MKLPVMYYEVVELTKHCHREGKNPHIKGLQRKQRRKKLRLTLIKS